MTFRQSGESQVYFHWDARVAMAIGSAAGLGAFAAHLTARRLTAAFGAAGLAAGLLTQAPTALLGRAAAWRGDAAWRAGQHLPRWEDRAAAFAREVEAALGAKHLPQEGAAA